MWYIGKERSFRPGIVLLFALLFPTVLRAQPVKPYHLPVVPKDTSTFLFFKEVTGGPYFTGGISRQNENLPNASTSLPWHSSPRFAFTIGATVDFAVNWLFGIDFSALYDSRDAYLADLSGSDNIDVNIGYLSFQPSIRIAWLLVGLAFDLPMEGSATEIIGSYEHADQPTQPYNQNLNIPTSDLAPMTELHAALSVPILESDNAELHFIVSGSYPLSKFLHSATPSFDTTGMFSNQKAPGQGPLPTVEAGLSYQFDLLHGL